MATHSSTRAWKIPWMEEPPRLQSVESQSWTMTERLHFHFSRAKHVSPMNTIAGHAEEASQWSNPAGVQIHLKPHI